MHHQLARAFRLLAYIAAITVSMTAAIYAEAEYVEVEKQPLELLSLDVISYEDLNKSTPEALETLKTALHTKGIVGVRSVPGYKESVFAFIEAARQFSALPDHIKNTYAPRVDLGEILGYDQGKEKFKRPDGRWVIDDLKTSYYALVPDCAANTWPHEIDLQQPFQKLGALMSRVGEEVMNKIELIGQPDSAISLDGVYRFGRMLYYKKSSDSQEENPYWCGAHFDHGVFTALIPAFYFVNGIAVPEPEDAGLCVRTTHGGSFKKVVASDPDVMLFQVGEFGQLISNDAICATEHRVHKASGNIERYTMALFINASMDAVIHSQSILTSDARYRGGKGDPCSFGHWHTASLDRYRVTVTDDAK